MSTPSLKRRLALALASILPLTALSCSTGDVDEAKYQDFLERHRSKDWITLTPENAEAYFDAKRALAKTAAKYSKVTSLEPKPAPGASEPKSTVKYSSITREELEAMGANLEAIPSLEFRETPLKDVVRMVARATGIDILVPDSLEQTVTLSLSQTDPVAALVAALEANGHRLIKDPNGLLVVQPIPEQQDEFITRTFRLLSTPVAPIEDALRKLVSPDGKLVLNADGSSFIMLDHPENIKLMEEYIGILDVREKQVIVEATIVEVRMQETEEVGVLLQFLDIGLDDAFGAIATDFLPTNSGIDVLVGSEKDPILGILQAVATHQQIHLLSMPKVATLSGHKAVIEVIERIPYVESTSTTAAGADGVGISTVEEIAFEEVGVTLTVTPTIGADRSIKMDIQPMVKELTAFFKGVPVVDRRKVTTQVVVKDGQTIVIGGIIREDVIREESKVPLFGDIPLLGFFFRGTEERLEKTELLVAITPRIIESGGFIPSEVKSGN